ncbi:MAG: L,D-transpeptidase family protein [Hyphomicrobium sp.]
MRKSSVVRTAVLAAALAAGGLALSGPAQTEPAPPSQATADIRQPLVSAILAELSARAARDDIGEEERAWLSELGGFYGMSGAAPLWVDAAGVTSRGKALADEIAAADRYGLDPEAFTLPSPDADPATAEVTLSLAATQYIWHARGGRIDPSDLSLWLDQTPRTVYASTVLSPFTEAPDVAAALRAHHPRHPQFEALRQALLRARGLAEQTKPLRLMLGGAVIARGERHLDVPIVRQRLGIPAEVGRETLADDEVIEGVRQFMRKAGFGKKKRVIDDDVRTAIESATERDHPRERAALIEKLVINMERWRWMPPDMGALHVWNNLPEYETRIVKDGEIIHRDRIIIGQPHTQTPVFSNAMSQVIFQPTWGLPPSIKLKQFGGRGNIGEALKARNMAIVDYDGTPIRASRINWGKVDIRKVPIVQGPGPGNPLGRLKFIFPNAHDVYMHDTPDKGLFEASRRTFSHGCMRTRNPERFAEVVLRERLGWTPADVARQLTIKQTTAIGLKQRIPVHVTYFTVVVDESGTLRQLDDIYGHDRRIADAMRGVPVSRIASSDPARAQLRQNEELARGGRKESRRSREFRMASYARPRSARPAAAKPAVKPFSFFSPKPTAN